VELDGDGTLEQRGAGWLFLKYLTDRFGGDLLRRLTAASAVGVDNIASATGKRWEDLLSEWAVALYANCLPASERPRTDSRYRYRSLDLERAFASISADGYPLKPVSLPFSDFILSASLPTNGASYLLVTSGSETRGLNLTLTGARARSAAHPDMQLTLFRVR
jgi:hypothetical protein